MHARELLYLSDSAANDEAVPIISAAGWQVHRTRDVTTAKTLLERKPVSVAVAALSSGTNPEYRGDLSQILYVRDNLRWVGLLRAEDLKNEILCTFIATHFFDFHTLPADQARLLAILGHAHGMSMLAENAARGATIKDQSVEMVGTSPVMQEVYKTIRKVATTDTPVLITGESGTGKELAARAIHQRSRRRHGPFVAVNCAALPQHLIQSELFGHEKGAFTGAVKRRIGSIEIAKGGTIFLDEIGDLSPDLQVVLLRFLQEKTIRRLGGDEEFAVDCRVIAATNVDLERAIEEGAFRQDLYFRLNVLNLEMPPLRQRVEDIQLIATYFLKRFRTEYGSLVEDFDAGALEAMTRYPWPGNIRELINRVRRASVLSEHRLIKAKALGLESWLQKSECITLEKAVREAEKETILRAIAHKGGNLSKTAGLLGISRTRLYRLLQKHDLHFPKTVNDWDADTEPLTACRAG